LILLPLLPPPLLLLPLLPLLPLLLLSSKVPAWLRVVVPLLASTQPIAIAPPSVISMSSSTVVLSPRWYSGSRGQVASRA